MATKKPAAPEAPEAQETRVTLTVACPTGRRFRAGLQFGVVPVEVEVTAEQAAQIQADPHLAVSTPQA